MIFIFSFMFVSFQIFCNDQVSLAFGIRDKCYLKIACVCVCTRVHIFPAVFTSLKSHDNSHRVGEESAGL